MESTAQTVIDTNTQALDELTCKMVFRVFEKDNFSIWKARRETKSKLENSQVTLKGNDLPDSLQTRFKFYGHYVTSKYGEAFEVVAYEPIAGKSKDEIVGYLSSKMVKGIGKTLAGRIVEAFASDAIDAIKRKDPELLKIKGMSSSKLDKASEAILASTYVLELVKAMAQYGLSTDDCAKIASKYGKNSLEVVKNNPYVLTSTMKWSFPHVDEIALAMGIEKISTLRISAACMSAMAQANLSGSTGQELQQFGDVVYALLRREISKAQIQDCIIELIKEKKLRCTKTSTQAGIKQCVFSGYFYDVEKHIAERLVELKAAKVTPIDNLDEKIAKATESLGITLDSVQTEAVKNALTHNVSCITGGPGAGKTTIASVIIKVYESTGREVILLAPTGKARKRIEETSEHTSFTIHSRLHLRGDEDNTDEMDVNIQNALIIADEGSMIDVPLMAHLVDAIGEGSSLLLMGDPDQLASVGPGAVLRDVISSGIIPTVCLKKIYRTDRRTLFENISKIRDGKTDLEYTDEFVKHIVTSAEESRNKIIALYKEKIEKYGMDNVMLLVPYRKGSAGVNALNQALQAEINPAGDGIVEYTHNNITYRTGDPVMHINKNTEDAVNGDSGYVKGVIQDGNELDVMVWMNDKLLPYSREDLRNLDLAYATTVHKSQGSEAKSVIFCLTKDFSAMAYRSIIYVAVSRAQEQVDIVCDNSFETAIMTDRKEERTTLLGRFLKIAEGQLVSV